MFIVDGHWSAWTRWFACNVTCGLGYQYRYRTCSEAQFGGNSCVGDSSQLQTCDAGPCGRKFMIEFCAYPVVSV